jgi:peptide/nickel transport system permease protein
MMFHSRVMATTDGALRRRSDPFVRLARVGASWTRGLGDDGALLLGGGLLLVLIVMATVVRLLWPHDPNVVDLAQALAPPSLDHPMGTDANGRDLFARFSEGAGISLLVGLSVAACGAILGSAIGIVSGLFSGWRDSVLMRGMDAILAFPPLILAMAVTVGLGAGITTAAIGIMLTSIPWYARILRSEVLRLRSQAYVEAAFTMGAPRGRIIRRHILPHLLPSVMTQAAAVFAYGILALAALGFVGLGAQVPTPDWGAMITEGLPFALSGQWWIAFFPGIGVLIATTGAAILADRGRDILDPRSGYGGI